MLLTVHIEFIARGLFVHWNHVLICWNPKGNYGYLPGGHIEFGESATAALSREMIEETGLRCRVGPLLLTHENRFATKKRPHQELNLVFAAQITDRAFKVASDRLCHVAQSQKTSITVHQDQSGSGRSPVEPPPVASREDHLEFRWLRSKQLKQVDIRPLPMRKWIIDQLTSGLDSTSGMLPTAVPSAQWLSSMKG
jgi:8-oxo-dGTP pyrophosphatase MutT (NUDIX family)